MTDSTRTSLELRRQYAVLDKKIYLKRKERDKNPTQLTNWTARITRDITYFGGGGGTTERQFHLVAQIGTSKKEFTLTPEAFEQMNWVTRELGPKAMIRPGHAYRDHVKSAIQQETGTVVSEQVFQHTGWILRNGRWGYLHGGGVIDGFNQPLTSAAEVRQASGGPLGPEGPVFQQADTLSVNLPDSLAHFRFPPPASSDDEFQKCWEAVDELLDCGQLHVTYPLVAAAFRAAIGENRLVVHLAGGSGNLKSSIAGVVQQFFGPEMDHDHLPASWSSTANALESMAATLKDSLLVVDDFAPTGSGGDIQRLNREAERLIRTKGNLSARQRCSGDGTLRGGKVPQALLLTTGEDVPGGMSLRARMFIIDIRPGDIDPQRLAASQTAAGEGTLAQLMASFVRWLCPRRDQILQQLTAVQSELKKEDQSPAGTHRRSWFAAKDLEFGFDVLIAFLQEHGLEAGTAMNLRRNCQLALATVCENQALGINEENVIENFKSIFAAMFVSRAAHLSPFGEEPWPETPQAWGYRSRKIPCDGGPTIKEKKREPGDEKEPQVVKEQKDESGDGEVVKTINDQKGKTGDEEEWKTIWEPQGTKIGWIEGDQAYLLPDLLYGMVQQIAGKQGRSFPLSKLTLHRRLVEAGIVIPDGNRGRIQQRKAVDGRRVYVLAVNLMNIGGLNQLDENTAGASAGGIAPFPGSIANITQEKLAEMLLV